MSDWKSALGKIADELRRSEHASSKVSPSVAKSGVHQSPDRRSVEVAVVTKPAASPTPPVKAPIQVLKVAAKGADRQPTPQAVRAPFPPGRSGFAKRSVTPTRTIPQSSALHRLRVPPAPQRRGAKAPAPPARVSYPEPNMKNYTIGYPDCDGSADQEWQTLGTGSGVGQMQPGRRSLCTVGLDFGTAFTKACVQVRNSTYVVHWDGCVKSAPSSSFLLPSIFSELSDGTCSLGVFAGAKQHSDIKMALLGKPAANDNLAATVFIALATRYIRAWLFTDHRDVVDGFRLDWSLNVGLPSSSWDDPVTCGLYKQLALAGWRLGSSPGPVTFAAAQTMLSVEKAEQPMPGQIDAEMVATFPEFGAQVHSYRSSAQRQRDLHLLVDIGAGTVDIVTFHIGGGEDSEINCILEPIVKKSGTHILLGYRAQTGLLTNSTWDDSVAAFNQAEFESAFGLKTGLLRGVQDHFAEMLHLSIRRVLHLTKENRYETSPAWSEGVPFFLSGGGRRVDAYREAIRRSRMDRRLIELSLPTPEDVVLGKMNAGQFHRLSVAHGLSFTAENLTKTLRRSDVSDLRRVSELTEDYHDRYIEK